MIWTEKEHEHMQIYLMMLKYYYYEEHTSVIPDINFDVAEKYTKDLQKKLNISENEDLPTDMVGFNYNSTYWQKAKDKYKFIKPKINYDDIRNI